jgi:hypothetical protein
MNNLIGGAWLAQQYSLPLAFQLASVSQIGGRRTTQTDGSGRCQQTYLEAMRPESDLRGHLTFHLKHESPSLELLSRLFEVCNEEDLVLWFRAEPTGQYARRACFLFEWMVGRQLNVEGATQGNYVDALDSDAVVAASPERSVPSRRWRVRDNLPGTPAFCPIVRKSDQAAAAMALDVARLLGELREEFGEALLMKSAVWMTMRESKSSFAIEGEGDKEDRIQRFASVLGRRTGQGEVPLTNSSLAQLQSEILGDRTSVAQFGLRQSPVFVGESVRFQEVVHYIAPPAQDLEAMLSGLQVFLDRTSGQSPVMRAAVAAFGFVYIHPLADGNGRVHRFLVNDILRRDNVVPDPLIVPISSLITADRGERRAYDRVLEEVSRPLMALLAGEFTFGSNVTYPDGINSNLQVRSPALAQPVWRMPDLTPHLLYLSDLIARTIREDMREESRYMRSHGRARAAIKDVIEMPDHQVDRVIRSIESSGGKLSNALVNEIPALAREGVWAEILAATQTAFQEGPTGDTPNRFRER